MMKEMQALRKEYLVYFVTFNFLMLIGGVYLYRNFTQYRSSNPTTIKSVEAASQEVDQETQKLKALRQNLSSSKGNDLVKKEELKFQAKKRKEKIVELVKLDPKRARESLLTKEEIQSFPPEVQAELEKPISVSGNYLIVTSDDFENGKSEKTSYIEIKSDDIRPIYVSDTNLKSQSHVVVEGMQFENIVFANGDTDTIKVDVLGTTSLAVTKGQKRLAIIAVNFSENPTRPYTIQEIRNTVYYDYAGTVNGYYKEVSGNQLSYKGVIKADGDVFGWYTLPMSSAYACHDNRYTLAQLADQQAAAHGFNTNNYDNVAYVAYGCGGGSAEIGKRLWVGAEKLVSVSPEQPEYTLSFLLVHELGHTIGLDHANTLLCKYPQDDESSQEGFASVWSGYCQGKEYDDYYDAMGRRKQHFSNYNKDYLGWLTSSNKTVIDQNGKTTITIAPIENVLAKNTVIVSIPGTSYDYYVEYRQPIGSIDRFATNNETGDKGVLIRFVGSLARNVPYGQSNLLFTDFPNTSPYMTALRPGKMYSDDVKNVYIKLESMNSSGATITVYRGVKPTNPTPVPQTCYIQGYKVVMPNNQPISPASSQTVRLDGGNAITSNPYAFTNVSAGNHTVSITTPSGYSVGYTSCTNSTGCHQNTPKSGSSVTVNCPAGGYVDLYWHFTPLPTRSVGTTTPPIISPVQPTGSGTISHQQTVTGGSSNSNKVTSSSITGSSGNIYLASVSTRTNIAVSSVTGLGLTWSRVSSQCAGRAQTRIETWKGVGTPSSGTVTANLSSTSLNSVIAVSRYSGGSSQNALIDPVARNTKGQNGACSGGTDSSSFSYTINNSNSKFVYVAAALRNKTFSPGSGYTERAEKSQGSSGDKIGIAIMDRSSTSSSTPVSGTFSGSTDWAVGSVELY